MNRVRLSRATFVFLAAGLALPVVSSAQEPKPAAVVTIEPPCPVEPPRPKQPGERSETVPVRVRYNPAAPGAKLTAPESLTIDLAINASYYFGSHRTFPMTRAADGTWEATIPLEAYWSFLIFMVKDQNDLMDSNGGNYWEIVTCGADGTPTPRAISYQSRSYRGEVFAPGIQRAVDYARAISIVEEDMKHHPDRIYEIADIWQFRVKQEGSSEAAWAKLAAEVERFLGEQKTNENAIVAAVQFVSNWRQRFPAALLDKAQAALVALNPKSPVLAELFYSRSEEEKDPKKRVALLEEYLAKYPQGMRLQQAYADRFYAWSHDLKDVAGTEKAFEEWRGFEPEAADVYASLGRFYAQQKIKPEKAVELLTKAIETCQQQVEHPIQRSRSLLVMCWQPDPKSPADGQARLDRDFAQMRYYRGQAQAQRGEMPAAIEDLQFAARILNDDWRVSMALGQVSEKAGRKEAAFVAYLDAATAPHQTSREPAEALERVFIAGGMGTREELDARIEARFKERRVKAAAEFKPVPFDRAAPAFEFTTLEGKRFDNAALRGRPVVLNFWASWCGPCVAEMPGFLELQRRNPGVTVIAVAMLSELPDVKAIIERRKWEALTVAHSEKTGTAFGVTSVPQTYVLDKDGRIRFVHADSLADVVAMIEKELTLLAK